MLDFQRTERLGFDEAIFCAGKSPGQLSAILDRAAEHGCSLLLTRLEAERLADLPSGRRACIDHDALSRTGFFGAPAPLRGPADAAIVTAGSSDLAVGREAARTLRYYGHASVEVADVGVAGLWRLLDRLAAIRDKPVVIVVAGMDAALPSVVGGLVPGAVIAVPTSIGYGVAAGGTTALHAALASCAPGVTVVNIDNGYGAACAALRLLNALARARGLGRERPPGEGVARA
jgi:NCAIR mutase (PurE)-related protein